MAEALPSSWLKLLRRAQEVGVDTAYGDLLAPWFMAYISRDLTTRIAEAGESSPKMFKLFSEHHEILPVLSYCKRLKAESVENLFRDGPAYAQQTLLSLVGQSASESTNAFIENILTYSDLVSVDHFPLWIAMVLGLNRLHLEEESDAFQQLNDILYNEDSAVQRLRAITADYVGLFYKNRMSGGHRSNRLKALKWLNLALAVLPEEEHGSEDWCAIKNNLGNAYLSQGGKDSAVDVEAALRHLKDVSVVLSENEESRHWAMNQDNLAGIYAQRNVGDRTDNLKLAIEYSERAEKAFTSLGLTTQRLKSLLNISRAYIEMGPLFIGRKSFDEPEGIGAELGVLDKAETTLREAMSLLAEAQFPDAGAMIHQSLAEIAIQRNELSGQDSLGTALLELAQAASLVAPDDEVRIAYIDFLATKVAAARLHGGHANEGDARESFDRAIERNRRIGNYGRAGECLFLRTLLVDVPRLPAGAEKWEKPSALFLTPLLF